jgi:diacylglycerol kinase (ATP)
MTSIALLHPNMSPKAVLPFQQLNPDLQIRSDLSSAEGLKAVLIFGGDGTVHRYLPELHQRKLPTLVVPVGSGNDFAKALGIRNVKLALKAWKQFCTTSKNVRQIDLGVIRSEGRQILFCCVGHCGVDAATNAYANRMPSWLRARGGYVLAALYAIANGNPVDMRLKLAEQPEISRKAWLVAVGNAHRYGSGARIVPKALLDDGQLDICVVNRMSRFRLLCALPTVYWGGHLKLKEVGYFRTAALRLESHPVLPVFADGEPVCPTPAEFSALAGALNVIVPV